MVELAEQVTRNAVCGDQLQKVRELSKANAADPQTIIEGVGLGAEIMALLNVFNDLVNVEIEGDMAALAERELGLDVGRHSTTGRDPDDLNFTLPEPELTVELALAARRERARDWRGIAQQHLGYVPAWLEGWPSALRSLFAGMYTELMSEGEISAELKHLMARVSAIAKGHPALAASAAMSAHHVATDKTAALRRIRQCYVAAAGRGETTYFAPEERLALRLAWLSAQVPIVTPAQFVKPLTEQYSQRAIVELCVACGMACAVQRMSAALQVGLGSEEAAFCAQHAIETDGLVLKYPSARPSSTNP